MTGAPSAFVDGFYREVHSPPVTDTVYATNNVIEVVCDTTSPGC